MLKFKDVRHFNDFKTRCKSSKTSSMNTEKGLLS